MIARAALFCALVAIPAHAVPVASSLRATGADGAALVDVDAGEGVFLAPGGFLDVEEPDGARMFCANGAASTWKAVYAGASQPPAAEPPLTCRATSNGAQHCEGGGAFCSIGPGATTRAHATTIYVMDFTATGASADAARLFSRLIAAELAGASGVQVIAGDDVRRLLGVGKDGPDDRCAADASCIAEAVAALGARYVVSGAIARAGRALSIEVSLLDSADARVLARERTQARDLVALSAYVDELARNLLAPVVHRPRVPLPVPDLGRTMDDPRALAGAGGLATASAAVPLVCLGGLSLCGVGYALFWDRSGNTYDPLGFVPALVAPPCCAFATAGVGAVIADLLSGAEIGWWRALGTACVAGACSLGGVVAGTPAAFTVAALTAANLGVPNPPAGNLVGATGLAGAAGGLVVGGVVAGAAYDGMIGLFGDTPAATGDERIDEKSVDTRASAQALAY